MANENEQIVDQSSKITEKTPTFPTPGVGKGSKNKLAWWVLGIVVVVGIGFGAYSLGQSQNSSPKANPTGSENDQISNIPIVTPNSKLQTIQRPSATNPTEPISKEMPKNKKTYSGKYYVSNYNFNYLYPDRYSVSFISDEEGTVSDENGNIFMKIGFSACSIPNDFPQIEFGIPLENYIQNGSIYAKLPENNGCISLSSSSINQEVVKEILSTFKFVKYQPI